MRPIYFPGFIPAFFITKKYNSDKNSRKADLSLDKMQMVHNPFSVIFSPLRIFVKGFCKAYNFHLKTISKSNNIGIQCFYNPLMDFIMRNEDSNLYP